MGDKCNCLVTWTFFITAPSWELGWGLTFSSSVATAAFPNLLTYWAEHFDSIIFQDFLNNSAEIPSPLLALLTTVLPKSHLTSHSRMSASGWVTATSWLSGSLRPFLYSSFVYKRDVSTSSWPLLLLLGLYCFCPLLCPLLDEMFLRYFQFSWRDL